MSDQDTHAAIEREAQERRRRILAQLLGETPQTPMWRGWAIGLGLLVLAAAVAFGRCG